MTLSSLEHRCNRLQAENDELREQIAQLKALLVETAELPREWGLTSQERLVFGVMVNRPVATREAIMVALYQDREEANIRIIESIVYKMRKKLQPFGVSVLTVWARGYALPAEERARWRLSARPTPLPSAKPIGRMVA